MQAALVLAAPLCKGSVVAVPSGFRRETDAKTHTSTTCASDFLLVSPSRFGERQRSGSMQLGQSAQRSTKKLSTFLEDFPDLPELQAWDDDAPKIEWETIIDHVTERGGVSAPLHPALHPLSDA